jgi:predicted transcriptional regulator
MPDWELISFIKASEIRLSILESLNERVQTPTELKEKFNVPISRVSSILKELSEKELVENLTPDRRKSKMFSLSKKGKSILQEIQKINGKEVV